MSEATVIKMWDALVTSRPRLREILLSLKDKEKTLYELQKEFGSASIHSVLKEMAGMGVIVVVREEKLPNGLTKKWYSVTDLGERLLGARASKTMDG